MSDENDFRARMLQMAESLLEATRKGRISWRLTDDEHKFIYAGTRSSVTVEHIDDQYNGEETVLALRNNRGTVVDSLGTESTQEGDRWAPAPWNGVLESLYHAARRVAYDVDKALESMMHDIERGTPSPEPSTLKRPVDDPWATTDPEEPPF